MKRILALALALMMALLCGAGLAEAEDYELGGGLWLRQERCFALNTEGDSGVLIMDAMTGGMLYCNVIDGATMGASAEMLLPMLSKGTHTLAWGIVVIDSETHVTGENLWATGTTTMEGETFDLIEILNGGTFILGMCMNASAEDMDGVVESIYRKEDDAAPGYDNGYANRVTPTMQALEGYYDMLAGYGVDANTNLFLTSTGHGTISANTIFESFDFGIVDGEIQIETAHDVLDALWLGDDGLVYAIMGVAEDGYLTLRFVKRETDSTDAQALLGMWKLIEFNGQGEADFAAQGDSMFLSFYESGTVDFLITTNGVTLALAKGWDRDDRGYYLDNGDQISHLTIDGDTLAFSQSGSEGNVDYIFARIEEEDFELCAGLYLRQGLYYAYDDEDLNGVVIVNANTGTFLICFVTDMGTEFRISDEVFAQLVPQLMAKGEYEDFGIPREIESDMHVTGENTWVTGKVTMADGDMDLIQFINGKIFIVGMCSDLVSMDVETLLTNIYRDSARAALAEAGDDLTDHATVNPGMLAGVYDYAMADVSLFLTPTGHGRLASIPFDYEVIDGEIHTDSDELDIWLDTDGRINVCLDNAMTFVFIRREINPMDAQAIAGRWRLTAVTSDGYTMQEDTLKMIGVSGSMTVYPNGAIDWHTVTNEESDVAQGWGVDEEGYYMDNDDIISRISINGNTLTIDMSTGSGSTNAMMFERMN